MKHNLLTKKEVAVFAEESCYAGIVGSCYGIIANNKNIYIEWDSTISILLIQKDKNTYTHIIYVSGLKHD